LKVIVLLTQGVRLTVPVDLAYTGLYGNEAPATVQIFKTVIQSGGYNGTIFSKVRSYCIASKKKLFDWLTAEHINGARLVVFLGKTRCMASGASRRVHHGRAAGI
jgi:hypothetical protein